MTFCRHAFVFILERKRFFLTLISHITPNIKDNE